MAKKKTTTTVTTITTVVEEAAPNVAEILPVAKKLVNHVVFVIDESGSMQYHAGKVSKVFNDLLTSMTAQSGQETRVSTYTFNNTIRNIGLDVPVSQVPPLHVRPNGGTAFIDASIRGVRDHLAIQQAAKVRTDEDHSYLCYLITDGEENASRQSPSDLATLIGSLDDDWTVATLVPNISGVHNAKRCGIPAGNIEVWNVNSATGFEDVGRTMSNTYASYSGMRSMGVKSTKSLFTVNANNLTPSVVIGNLVEQVGEIFAVPQDGQVRDVAELITSKPYQTGSVFYELLKKEEVNAKKELVIVNKATGKKYGGQSARALLGLPFTAINVAPGDFGEWRIFVQSTSVNRKIPKGTNVFIR